MKTVFIVSDPDNGIEGVFGTYPDALAFAAKYYNVTEKEFKQMVKDGETEMEIEEFDVQ